MMKLVDQNPCVHIPALSLTSCANQGQSLTLSGPLPWYLHSEDNSSYVTGHWESWESHFR